MSISEKEKEIQQKLEEEVKYKEIIKYLNIWFNEVKKRLKAIIEYYFDIDTNRISVELDKWEEKIRKS